MPITQPVNPVPAPSTPAPLETQPIEPSQPEINPAEPGNATEVDLDRNRTETYPQTNPPVEH